jgi:hypothetical protein
LSNFSGEYFDLQRSAEKLGMTNGDHVFFMITLGRGGIIPDKFDDTWWKVTNENDDLVNVVD